jgi:hypothetical protein
MTKELFWIKKCGKMVEKGHRKGTERLKLTFEDSERFAKFSVTYYLRVIPVGALLRC